jgi:hypothetical protein
MSGEIKLTSTFFIMQSSLLVIVATGLFLLSTAEDKPSLMRPDRAPVTRLWMSYALVALVTMLLLIFTDEVVGSSQPMFGEIPLPSNDQSSAFLAVFILDIVCAGLLMLVTGGPRNSPFSPVLFMLPTLAIFLRESPLRFFIYTAIAAALFLLTQATDERRIEENQRYRLTLNIVTLLCLGLNTVIGFVTRPV